MSFCQKCGAPTPVEDTFCGSCGAKLSPLSPPAQPNAARATMPEQPAWMATNPEGMVYVNKKQRAVVNFLSPKCPYCGMKGEIVYIGWQKAKVEHGYGIVTRRVTQSVTKTDKQGRKYTEQVVTDRQERAPISQSTYRYHYHCLACNNSWTKDTMKQEEDFSAPPQATLVKENNTVLTREVVKVPCRHCGVLIDPVRYTKCPSCGANLSMGK